MARRIVVHSVPDELHRELSARASRRGVSLSAFVLAELTRAAGRLSAYELAESSRTIIRDDFVPSPAELLRGDRER